MHGEVLPQEEQTGYFLAGSHLGRWLEGWSPCWFSLDGQLGSAGKELGRGQALLLRSEIFRVKFTCNNWKGEVPLSIVPVLDALPNSTKTGK